MQRRSAVVARTEREVIVTRKFAGLELLRFLAAAAVLFWHYQHFFYGLPPGD